MPQSSPTTAPAVAPERDWADDLADALIFAARRGCEARPVSEVRPVIAKCLRELWDGASGSQRRAA